MAAHYRGPSRLSAVHSFQLAYHLAVRIGREPTADELDCYLGEYDYVAAREGGGDGALGDAWRLERLPLNDVIDPAQLSALLGWRDARRANAVARGWS